MYLGRVVEKGEASQFLPTRATLIREPCCKQHPTFTKANSRLRLSRASQAPDRHPLSGARFIPAAHAQKPSAPRPDPHSRKSIAGRITWRHAISGTRQHPELAWPTPVRRPCDEPIPRSAPDRARLRRASKRPWLYLLETPTVPVLPQAEAVLALEAAAVSAG